MKKKILMLVMAVLMVCLVGCGNDTKVQEKPITNNNEIVEVSGESTKNEAMMSGEVLSSGDLDAIMSAYASAESVLPEEIKEYTAAFYPIEVYSKGNSEEKPQEIGLSTLLEHLKNDSDPYSKLSYALKDVNGDGVNELLIYDNTMEDKNVIVSMFTLIGEDRECYHILNSQTNYRFKLCENNVIKNEFTDVEDTGETFIGYYTLNKECNLEEKVIPSGETVNYVEIEVEKKPIK